MATNQIRTAALILVGFTLTAVPSFAQRRGASGGPLGGERAAPRTEQRQAPRTEQRQPDARRQPDVNRSAPRNENRSVERAPRTESPRFDQRSNRSRIAPQNDSRYRNNNFNNNRYRGGSYNGRSYYAPRSFGYGSRYASPYGYRLYSYRPGLSLYFGLPYSTYGYRSGGVYGYYTAVPGRYYGSLRIVDAPEDAQVFVDGYYAGVVDDYDGVFQRLNLEPGQHRIEIEVPGYERSEFDVRIVPGETVTYHARF